MEQQDTIIVPYPHAEVFQHAGAYDAATAGFQEIDQLGVFDRVDYPPEGGRLFYMHGVPFPLKGHVFPEAVAANNFVKRSLITQLNFFARHPSTWLVFLRAKGLDDWLRSFNDLAKLIQKPYRLKPKYYCRPAWELWQFCKHFLMALGVAENRANAFGNRFATIIEYDDAYRYIVEDIASETTSYQLIKSPRKEVKRLLGILQDRSPNLKIQKHFGVFATLLSWALIIPRFRNAFDKGVGAMQFKNLQMDAADRYHTLSRGGYKFGGVPDDIRRKKYQDIHSDGLPPSAIVQ